MSKPFPTGWLVGGIILVTALGLAGSLIPFRPCETCDGLVQFQVGMMVRSGTSLSGPVPESIPSLDCPDCGDRGKVSLFRSWKGPSVSEQVGKLIRGLKDVTSSDALREMKTLLQNDGKNPKTPVFGTPDVPFVMRARFLGADQSQYLLVLTHPSPFSSNAGIVLLSPQGKVLDAVQVFFSWHVQLEAWFLEESEPDGARILVVPTVENRETLPLTATYRVHQLGQVEQSGKISFSDKSEKPGPRRAWRFGVRSGRLDVQPPDEK